MRWAFLLMGIAGICAAANVVRGVLVWDGLALLAVAFMVAAFLAAFLSWLVAKARRDGERR